jgi:hypothetical protein
MRLVGIEADSMDAAYDLFTFECLRESRYIIAASEMIVR